ncbi:MAG: RNA polymerase sigma-70 factor [Cyclobacteriaceae bacterium]
MKEEDELEFRKVFEANYSHLVNTSYRIVGSVAAAEDIVQDVFMKLWHNRKTISIHSSVKSYLQKAAINSSLNYIRKSDRHLDLKAEHEPHVSGPEEELYEKELREKINSGLQKLAPQCRLVFSLSRYDGLTNTQIADQLGISKKTVENQIYRALQVLRDQLKNSKTGFFILAIALLTMLLSALSQL